MQRAKKPRFQPGIVDANFDAALEWLNEIGYDGPLSLAADDTKMTRALQSYCDGGEWRLAGMHGCVKVFTSYEQLTEMCQFEETMLADKVYLTVERLHELPLNQYPAPSMGHHSTDTRLPMQGCRMHAHS